MHIPILVPGAAAEIAFAAQILILLGNGGGGIFGAVVLQLLLAGRLLGSEAAGQLLIAAVVLIVPLSLAGLEAPAEMGGVIPRPRTTLKAAAMRLVGLLLLDRLGRIGIAGLLVFLRLLRAFGQRRLAGFVLGREL